MLRALFVFPKLSESKRGLNRQVLAANLILIRSVSDAVLYIHVILGISFRPDTGIKLGLWTLLFNATVSHASVSWGDFMISLTKPTAMADLLCPLGTVAFFPFILVS